MLKKKTAPRTEKRPLPPVKYVLCLYVAGETSKSVSALANLKKICSECLDGSYRIKVIDLLNNPKLARDHQILALPTLVRNCRYPCGKSLAICPTLNACWSASI